jgi:serine/threonine protein phosphatase PrpC
MTLQLLDQLSLPGDPAKPNEDFLVVGKGAALVMDGATPLGDGLMPGPSDAAWIAQFGARRLMAHLDNGDGTRKALRSALTDAEKSFKALRRHPPAEMWQMPCASMMLAVPADSGVECLWYGDCAALLKRGETAVTVIGETFDKRAAEAMRAKLIAKEKDLSPASGINRPKFIGSLRAIRNRVNSGDYWLFSPDARAASHVSRRVIKAGPGAVLLLATDGFLALASDYDVYSADSLIEAALSKGLAAMGEELRAIEAGDSGGEKFPRFKKSDDATALLIKIS